MKAVQEKAVVERLSHPRKAEVKKRKAAAQRPLEKRPDSSFEWGRPLRWLPLSRM